MPNFIRTARPSGDIRSFTWTVDQSGGVTEGLLYWVNHTVVAAFQTKNVGEDVAAIYHCEKLMLHKAAVAIGLGSKLYWDGIAGNPVTPVYASGMYWIGICVQAALAEDTHVKADLKGDKVSLTEPL